MTSGKTRVMAAALVALVLVGLLVAACQTAPVSPVQVEITNWEAAAPLTGNFGEAEEPSRAAGNVEQVRALRVLNDVTVGGALSAADLAASDDLTVADDLDVNGDVTIGTAGRYPVENASANRIIEFGATGAISQTVVTPVAISTVTAYGCTVNSPSAAAQLCYAVASGGVLTFTVYNAAATPAAIVTPHAAGASYWIGGN